MQAGPQNSQSKHLENNGMQTEWEKDRERGIGCNWQRQAWRMVGEGREAQGIWERHIEWGMGKAGRERHTENSREWESGREARE